MNPLSIQLRRQVFGRGIGGAARGVGRAVRRTTHAGGAGESGLARMTELHLVSSAADAMVVTALASTIFFSVPTEQARSRVLTSLLVTMVPFVVLAPLIGPLLDRVRRGRRIAIGVTMGARAWLAWVMASALTEGQAGFALYPAAFAFLVSQKAYLVVRAAALPRVLPPGGELVGANARMSAAGVVAMAIGGPLGVGCTHWLGPEWTLRVTFVLYLVGVGLTLALTARVDSTDATAELPVADPGGVHDGATRPLPTGVLRTGALHWGARSVIGLRGNAAFRAVTGFLTLFLAFRLRTEPLPGWSATAAVGLVIALAAVGGAIGTALGALVRGRRPEVVVVVLVGLLTVAAAWPAFDYRLASVLVVALVAGLAQSLGKLCLDALIQDEVPDARRTSAFARSETVLQLAWVLGGAIGLALPLSGAWGLGVAAVALAVVLAFSVRTVVTRAGNG